MTTSRKALGATIQVNTATPTVKPSPEVSDSPLNADTPDPTSPHEPLGVAPEAAELDSRVEVFNQPRPLPPEDIERITVMRPGITRETSAAPLPVVSVKNPFTFPKPSKVDETSNGIKRETY